VNETATTNNYPAFQNSLEKETQPTKEPKTRTKRAHPASTNSSATSGGIKPELDFFSQRSLQVLRRTDVTNTEKITMLSTLNALKKMAKETECESGETLLDFLNDTNISRVVREFIYEAFKTSVLAVFEEQQANEKEVQKPQQEAPTTTENENAATSATTTNTTGNDNSTTGAEEATPKTDATTTTTATTTPESTSGLKTNSSSEFTKV
jgi:hypothetical protein